MREHKKNTPAMPPHHPDQHELIDWAMYGPKDRRIEHLVRQLAFEHGLRLRDIETWIVTALEEKLVELNRND
ncbi:hypothetical protein [Celeribacter sp.]|uniref:hypothetical protein n=1 Tax=Celeribacter sp. TaxID=1890673 RepID=UPI003A93956C